MDPAAILRHLADTYPGVAVVEAAGDFYVFYDPPGVDPPDRRFPFVTLVTDDRHDPASQLHRPGVYRLNVGVRKETYVARFGPPPAFRTDGTIPDTGHDYAALDVVMPHPVYAAMHWVCVLNPSDATFEREVRPLLAEAYALKKGKRGRRRSSARRPVA